MNILIVDDEQLAVQGIIDGIDWERLGFDKVMTANSYQEAVNAFKSTYFDILLSDIEMPGESGLKLIEYVNEHSPMTECIILSCHDEFDYARTAVRLNCMEYALKPIRYHRLTEILLHAQEKVQKRHEVDQLSRYGSQYINDLAREIKSESGDALETAVAYIDAHLSEEIAVKDLAGICFVSADHLTRLFKKKYGLTVTEIIQQKRLHLARKLLLKENITISAVSCAVGFSNYSYFTEQFKKHFGLTPREYQKQNRK